MSEYRKVALHRDISGTVYLKVLYTQTYAPALLANGTWLVLWVLVPRGLKTVYFIIVLIFLGGFGWWPNGQPMWHERGPR